MNILAFNIKGQFWHFRKFYTTTSPLSFQIPPFTVVKWIIAGILWLEKDIYNEDFNKIKLWLEINSNVSEKKMFGLNLRQTKDSDYKRWITNIRVKQETLIKPNYTIYIAEQDFDYYEQLKNKLENNSWIYTPYLGISEFIADVKYIWEMENINLLEWTDVSIDSIIPQEYFDRWKNIQIKEWEQFEFEKVPFAMDNNRNLLSLKEFLFNPQGESITLKDVKYYKFKNKNIILC